MFSPTKSSRQRLRNVGFITPRKHSRKLIVNKADDSTSTGTCANSSNGGGIPNINAFFPRSPTRSKSMTTSLPSERRVSIQKLKSPCNDLQTPSTHSILEFSGMNGLSTKRIIVSPQRQRPIVHKQQQQQTSQPQKSQRSTVEYRLEPSSGQLHQVQRLQLKPFNNQNRQAYPVCQDTKANNDDDDDDDEQKNSDNHQQAFGERVPSFRAIGKTPKQRVLQLPPLSPIEALHTNSCTSTSTTPNTNNALSSKPFGGTNPTIAAADITKVANKKKAQVSKPKHEQHSATRAEMIVDRFPSIHHSNNSFSHSNGINQQLQRSINDIPEVESFAGEEEQETKHDDSSICSIFSGCCDTVETRLHTNIHQRTKPINSASNTAPQAQRKQQETNQISLFDRTLVTISPGCDVPFVGLEEAMYACHLGQVVIENCTICQSISLCHEYATLYVCPCCSAISPVLNSNNSNRNNNDPLFAMGIPLDDVPQRRRFSG